jgi:hypothetical protein
VSCLRVLYHTGYLIQMPRWGADVGEVEWERARLFPVSGIGGADEQERRAASALLAVVQSVREFGRAITVRWARRPAGYRRT